MRRILALAFLLQGMLVLGFMCPVRAVSEVDILTHKGFLYYDGFYHVVGEVENTGEQAVNSMKITATFYDSDDAMIATEFNYTCINVLLPKRKSPFEVIVANTTQAEKVHHYSLTVDFSLTEALPLGLEISSDSLYVDGGGRLHVVGEIKNIGEQTATHIKVIATFYDETGKVVASEFTFSDPDDLDPDQSAPFEIILAGIGTVPSVASYALTAESSQYAIIPEFSLSILLPLFMILASVAVLIARKRTAETT